MTTNQERTADIIWEEQAAGIVKPADLAQALADAGLLMPDLPEPSGWQDGSFTGWLLNEDVAVKVNQKGAIIIEHMDVGWFALPTEDASRFADMIKSAADYAEQEQK